MTMIDCPECKNTVSGEAAACPSCGYPLKPPPARRPKTKGMPGWVIALIVVGSLAAMAAPVLLMAAIAYPAFAKARSSARLNACVNNLRIIDAAKDEYAIEYGGTNGVQYTWDNLSIYVKNMKARTYCPAAPETQRGLQNYEINPLGTDPECKVRPGEHRLISAQHAGE